MNNLHHILARLGWHIATRMSLKQFGPQPRLQRIDMADHCGMMDPQNLGGAADRAHARHFICSAKLIPIS